MRWDTKGLIESQTQSEWAACPVKDGYVWMNNPQELSLEQKNSLLINRVFSLCVAMMHLKKQQQPFL